MSLEAAILENTATLKELIARLTNTALTLPAGAVETKSEDLPITKKVTPPKAEPAKVETKEEKKPVGDSKPKAQEAIDYKTVSDLILALSKKNRQGVIDLLGEFDAQRGPDLKPEQYPAFAAKAKELLAA